MYADERRSARLGRDRCGAPRRPRRRGAVAPSVGPRCRARVAPAGCERLCRARPLAFRDLRADGAVRQRFRGRRDQRLRLRADPPCRALATNRATRVAVRAARRTSPPQRVPGTTSASGTACRWADRSPAKPGCALEAVAFTSDPGRCRPGPRARTGASSSTRSSGSPRRSSARCRPPPPPPSSTRLAEHNPLLITDASRLTLRVVDVCGPGAPLGSRRASAARTGPRARAPRSRPVAAGSTRSAHVADHAAARTASRSAPAANTAVRTARGTALRRRDRKRHARSAARARRH